MMVIGQQHCLALGALVPKEINAFRKHVGVLVPVAALSAGGGFSLWSKGCKRLLPCPIPGEWLLVPFPSDRGSPASFAL